MSDPDRRRTSVVDDIVESMREQIVTGSLQRGTRLPSEEHLAARFEVSQPTFREALRVLSAMGLVETRHGSGTYVTGDPHRFINRSIENLIQLENVGVPEILQVRQALGELSAETAAAHATHEDLQQIEQAAAELDNTSISMGVEEAAEAMLRWAGALSSAAHNGLLFALETYLGRLLIEFQLVAWSGPGAEWVAPKELLSPFRARVIAALHRRDPDASRAAMRAYYDRLREEMIRVPAFANLRISDPVVARGLADLRSIRSTRSWRHLETSGRPNQSPP